MILLDFNVDGCQYPVTGEVHFYVVKWVAKVTKEVCQYPVTGEVHFYDLLD